MKKKISLALLIIAIFFAVAFLVSQAMLNIVPGLHSTPTPIMDQSPLIDTSLINGAPCAQSCWYGLIPGQSSLEEVKKLLQELDFVKQSSITIKESTLHDGMKQILINFQCLYDTGYVPCGSLLLLDGTLDWIRHEIAYDLTIKEAVEIIGEPDLLLFRGRRDHGCNIDFTWSEKGIIATHKGVSSTACEAALEAVGKVPPDLLISRLFYINVDKLISCEVNCIQWQGMIADTGD